MIEIKCTKRQKATIIASLQNPNGCLWPQSQITCCLDPKMTCQKCFENRIKWIHSEKKVKKEDLLTLEDPRKLSTIEPVIHTWWEWYEEPVTPLCPDPDYGWRCSRCKEDAERMIERAYPHSNVEFVDDDKPPKIDYCPNCGAKMDGGENCDT